MLTLTCNRGGGLRFGKNGEIQMYILEVNRGQIKLGFKAPPSTRIERKELYIRRQQRRKKTVALSKKQRAKLSLKVQTTHADASELHVHRHQCKKKSTALSKKQNTPL